MAPIEAYADWRSDIGVFRVGIVTGDATSQVTDAAEPFRLALVEALEMEVEFFRGRTPQALINALKADRIEYAVLSASSYALAWTVCECVEPLVTPRSVDSSDGYHLVVIANANGPKQVSEITAPSLASVLPDNSIEQGFANWSLQKDGVDIRSDAMLRGESSEETLDGFANGDYPAIIGWSTLSGLQDQGFSQGTLTRLAQIQGGSNAYSVIWKSKQLPHRAHTVRKKLPGEAKTILRNFMSSLYERNPVAYDIVEPHHAGGFVAARHSRYQPLVEYLKSVAPVIDGPVVGTPDQTQELQKENPPE
jgi:phosphonate transport system substrate-binding protein